MTFLNPYLIGGIAFLAIPLVIHLLNLNRYRVVEFTNVRLLKRGENQSKRRVQRKNLLLLAIRCMIFLIITLLFAGLVFLQDKGIDNFNYISTVYLDATPSMLSKLDGSTQSKFEKSKSIAVELVKFKDDINDLKIYATSRYSDLSGSGSSSKFLVDKIEKLRVTNLQADKDVEFKNEDRTLIISDFQSNSRFFEIIFNDTSIKFLLLPLVNSTNANFFIDTLYVSDFSSIVEGIVRITIQAKWTGTNYIKSFPVHILNNDRIVQSKTYDFAPNQLQNLTVEIPLQFDSSTQYTVSFNDGYNEFDDKFYFTLPVFSRVTVYDFSRNYQVYEKLYGNSELFEYKRVDLRNVNYSLIESGDIFVIDENIVKYKGLLSYLLNRLSAGAQILISPFSTENVEDFHKLLLDMGVQYQRFKAINKDKFDETQFDKSALSFFQDIIERSKEGVQLPVVNPYSSFSSTNSLLKQRDGHSIISIEKRGRGTLMIVNALLDVNSDLSRSSIFLPVVYKFSLVKNSFFNEPLYHRLDGVVSGKIFSKLKSKSGLVLITPSGDELVVSKDAVGREFFISDFLNEDADVGFYKFLNSDTLHTILAFNGIRDESKALFPTDLQVVDKFSGVRNVKLVTQEEVLGDNSTRGRTSEWFNPWFLVLVVFTLISLEVYLLKKYYS